MSAVLNEKSVMAEVLELYREMPCLWDPNHSLYNNKDARKKAYEVLLVKFKLVNEDADAVMVKKKIENMRACYRRERKKMFQGILKRGEEYKTSLWYFQNLRFLDRVLDGIPAIDMDASDATDSLQMDDQDCDEEDSVVKPELDANLTSVFVTNDEEEDEDVQKEIQSDSLSKPGTEAEAFGRTIGFQLAELDSEQRYIAEKLMSDVIYYARFNKLNVCTRLSNV